MDKSRGTSIGMPEAAVAEAWQQVGASFERFCLTAGVSALSRMMEQDAVELCGPRYGHKDDKAGHRWGKTQGKIWFHGGKVAIGPAARSCPQRPGDGPAELGGGGVGRPAGPLGDEPEADQCLDPSVWSGGAAAGGGHSGHGRGGGVEVCGIAPLRGAIGGADGR